MNEQSPNGFPAEVNGVPLIQKILSGWRWLVAFGVLGAIVGFVMNSIQMPMYRAEAVILLPPSTGGTGIASLIPGASGGGSPGDILVGIIESRAMKAPIAKEVDIKLDDLKLDGTMDQKSSQVSVTATAPSKDTAVKIVEKVLNRLNSIRSEMNEQTYERQASQLETAINGQESKLTSLKVELASKANKMAYVPDMSQGVSNLTPGAKLAEIRNDLKKTDLELSSMRELTRKTLEAANSLPVDHPISLLRDKVRQKELEVNTLKIQLADQNPSLVRARREYNELSTQLRDEISRYLKANDAQLGEHASELLTRKLLLQQDERYYTKLAQQAPADIASYTALFAKVVSQEAQLNALKGNYAQVLLQLQIDPIGWATLVHPYAENDPINKSAGRMMAMWGFFGMFAASAAVLIFGGRKKRR